MKLDLDGIDRRADEGVIFAAAEIHMLTERIRKLEQALAAVCGPLLERNSK